MSAVHGSINWFLLPCQSLDAPSLQNVSVTVKSQQLLAVIGPVGAGKVSTSLHVKAGTAEPLCHSPAHLSVTSVVPTSRPC